MKLTVLHGSPRKGMNSDRLTERFLEGYTGNRPETDIEHFYINEMEISPCQGCLHCSAPPHECVITDDFDRIRQSYNTSEIIVFATPMYWGYMTAQLKTVMDRMEALAWEDFFGNTVVVIITYRHHYESTVNFFKRIAPYFKLKVHFVTCCTYDRETFTNINISECPKELNESYELGRSLVI
ncbi:MAG TPA: flavodoxin family protein [Clostridiales bacterium]|nr:flavodoxin family protein [Clostridiales bacterium]